MTYLTPVPALHQRDAAQAFLAAHQHGQQAAWRGAGGDFVAAGADLAVLTGQAKPGVQRKWRGLGARIDHGLRHRAWRGAGLDRQVQRGLAGAGVQRLVQPPQAAQTGQQGQRQQAGQPFHPEFEQGQTLKNVMFMCRG